MDQGDPIADLFVAQSDRPEHVGGVNLRTLSPYHRALLATDGTVTKFIEAYKMQRVRIRHLGQESRVLTQPHRWLDIAAGSEVIVREVSLEGQESHELYAYAVSLVVPDRLEEKARRSLTVDGDGLGRILLRNRVESFREILWFGRETLTVLPSALARFRGQDFLSRTYRIIVGGKPVMLISEKFPCREDDGLPLHH